MLTWAQAQTLGYIRKCIFVLQLNDLVRKGDAFDRAAIPTAFLDWLPATTGSKIGRFDGLVGNPGQSQKEGQEDQGGASEQQGVESKLILR